MRSMRSQAVLARLSGATTSGARFLRRRSCVAIEIEFSGLRRSCPKTAMKLSLKALRPRSLRGRPSLRLHPRLGGFGRAPRALGGALEGPAGKQEVDGDAAENADRTHGEDRARALSAAPLREEAILFRHEDGDRAAEGIDAVLAGAAGDHADRGVLLPSADQLDVVAHPVHAGHGGRLRLLDARFLRSVVVGHFPQVLRLSVDLGERAPIGLEELVLRRDDVRALRRLGVEELGEPLLGRLLHHQGVLHPARRRAEHAEGVERCGERKEHRGDGADLARQRRPDTLFRRDHRGADPIYLALRGPQCRQERPHELRGGRLASALAPAEVRRASEDPRIGGVPTEATSRGRRG